MSSKISPKIPSSHLTKATSGHDLSAKIPYNRTPTGKNVALRGEMIMKRKRRMRSKAASMISATQLASSVMDTVTDARSLKMAELTDHIFSKGGEFVTSACNISYLPYGNPAIPEVAFSGRWKVGKTALLRSIFKSRFPINQANNDKRKEAINYFNVGDVFNIAETPGFGGKHVPFHVVLQHAALLRNFVRCRPNLKMLYYCIDTDHKEGLIQQDIDMLKFLSHEVPNHTIVLTKGDRIQHSHVMVDINKTIEEHQSSIASDDPNKSIRLNKSAMELVMDELRWNKIHHPMLVTSAFRMAGIDTLRYDMVSNCLHNIPTEKLSYAEAKNLGKRLFTKGMMAAVRPDMMILPTVDDDAAHEWAKQIAREKLEAANIPLLQGKENSRFTENATLDIHVGSSDEDAEFDKLEAEIERELELEEGVDTTDCEIDNGADVEAQENLFDDDMQGKEGDQWEKLDPKEAGVQSPTDTLTMAAQSSDNEQLVDQLARAQELVDTNEDRRRNLISLQKKLNNTNFLEYVRNTSPWRNPVLWPSHIIPTGSLKKNTVRCPQDDNPYLYQSRFVTPRMDMCFRRPNIREHSNGRAMDRVLKGTYYHSDASIAALAKPYTIPYFPDIIDVKVPLPMPKDYTGVDRLRREGAQVLALRATSELKRELVDALSLWSMSPSLTDMKLNAEVKRLEKKRWEQDSDGTGEGSTQQQLCIDGRSDECSSNIGVIESGAPITDGDKTITEAATVQPTTVTADDSNINPSAGARPRFPRILNLRPVD